MSSTPCREQEYFACRSEPAGLLVVDTRTMEVVHADPEVARIRLTPDGRHLLASGAALDYLAEPSERYIDYGLKLIDTEMLELRAHLQAGRQVRVAAISRDGRYAYLSSQGEGWTLDCDEMWRCDEDCQRISVLDIEAAEVIAVRASDVAHVGLVDLGPPRPQATW